MFSFFPVDPPSDLNFKIIDENTVHMSWTRPVDPIVGYRITVDPTTGESRDMEVFRIETSKMMWFSNLSIPSWGSEMADSGL